MRLGILGGTFDPIHIAHLIIAEEAREQLDLAAVVFIPAGDPWLKASGPLSPGDLRLDMVRRATASNPFFQVSDIEVKRSGPTYTVDTLVSLHSTWEVPTEAFFILGLDALIELPRWRDPERFVELCTPVVFTRSANSLAQLEDVKAVVPGLREKLCVLEGPVIEVSSTEIRRRIAVGGSVRYMVPPEVSELIARHGLYKGESTLR